MSPKYVLAGVFVLAGLMLVLPDYRGTYPLSPKQLFPEVWQAKDRIPPSLLKQWIREGKKDYLLIDLRAREAFQASSIPGAVNYPLLRFQSRKLVYKLRKEPLVILYGEREGDAALVWAMLRTAGVNAKYLQGGFEGWESLERPASPPAAAATKAESKPKPVVKPKPPVKPTTSTKPSSDEEEDEEDLGC